MPTPAQHGPRAVASLLSLVLLLPLAGCIFPYLRTERPNLALRVQDAQGRPIEGATVTLASYSLGFVTRLEGLETATTDATGVAGFTKQARWHLNVMVPDIGLGPFDWSWCVEKPGYALYVRNDLDRQPELSRSPEPIILRPSASGAPEACFWNEDRRRFEQAGPG